MSEFWSDVIVPALNRVVQDILGVLPEVAGAVSILIVGWVIARIVSGLVSKLLRKVGFNSVAERAGISDFLKRSNFSQDVCHVLGRLIFWTIMTMFILSAAEAMQLDALAQTLQKVVAYIPNFVVIIVVLVFGSLLSRVAGKLVTGAAVSAGIDFAELLGKLTSNFILIAIFVVAISQLEIHSAVIDYVFIALLAAVVLALAITIGFGTRDVARGIVYGVYARKIFEAGQQVKLGDQEGELLQIGTINSVIRTDKEIVSMPNSAFIEGTVRIVRDERGES